MESELLKTIEVMREQYRQFEMQVRTEQKRRKATLAKVVVFGNELKAQGEIEDVIFPGDDPDQPECILVLNNTMGLVRVMYMPALPGSTEHPESLRVDVSPLPDMSFDLEVCKFFSVRTDIMEYVAKCVAVLQAHGVARMPNKALLKLAREGRFVALTSMMEGNPEMAMFQSQQAATTALIALTDTVMKLAEQLVADKNTNAPTSTDHQK